MIGYLQGQPLLDQDLTLTIVNGVGYHVQVGTLTRYWLTTQTTVELWIYTHVREDQLELFGFRTSQERQLFTLVLSVSGVGPKTALQIVDKGLTELTSAIQTANVAYFSSIPRVGKKLAQKIIIELGSKVGEINKLQLGPETDIYQTVKSALLQLGFTESAIHPILQKIDVESQSPEHTIKQALKQLTASLTK